MTNFMCDDEPLSARPDDNVGARHGFIGCTRGSGGLSRVNARLAEPGEADG